MDSIEQSERLPLVLRLHDRALEHAQEYGEEISHADILYAFCHTRETAEILDRKGINHHRLTRDINALQVYGWETLLAADSSDAGKSNLKQMIFVETLRLHQKLNSFKDLNEVHQLVIEKYPEDHARRWAEFLINMGTFLVDRDSIQQEMEPQRTAIKQMLVLQIAEKLEKLSKLDLNSKRAIDWLLALSKETVLLDGAGPDSFFEMAKQNTVLSPALLFDLLLGQLDEKHLYLLYRNGMVAPAEYQIPTKLPDDGFLDLLAKAFRLAYERRDPLITRNHLFLALMADRNVATMLHRAEVDDLSKFEKQVTRELFGPPDTEERFRHYIKVEEKLGRSIKSTIYKHKSLTEIILAGMNPPKKKSPANKKIKKVISGQLQSRDLNALYTNPDLREEGLFPAVLFLHLLKALDVGIKCEKIPNWAKITAAYEKELFDTCQKAVDEHLLRKPGEEKANKADFKISDLELENLLKEFATDLVDDAKKGKLDPVIGRVKELDQIVKVLLRRNRANPMLIGEPGVGKSVLFEGLAQRLAAGKVPKQLIGAQIHLLDMGKMNAGTMFRGSFEERLKPIIEGVAERNAVGDRAPIILAMDEGHAGMQAGSAMGAPGASEHLKPFLASRHSRFMTAMTFEDYVQGPAKNKALARRFTPIFIEEPPEDDAKKIVGGVSTELKAHHGVEISDDIIDRVVPLAIRYLPGRNNPDKSIEILDEACVEAREANVARLTENHVLTVIGRMANLPADYLKLSDAQRYLQLEEEINKNVFDQQRAAKAVCNALVTAAAHMNEDNKPIGHFAFVGPTGVGKTELGRVLAQHLQGSEDALVRLDMSFYSDRHTISRLIGAPPGYVGYEEEGLLTGPVRRNPYSVVLLDEFDKAHHEIFKILMPIADHGRVHDMAGRDVDFRNTLLITSANLDAHEVFEPYANKEELTLEDEVMITGALSGRMNSKYPPEYINRLDGMIVFYPLKAATMLKIAERELTKVKDRAKKEHKIRLNYGQDVIEDMAKRGYSQQYGARPMKRLISNEIIVPFSKELLRSQGSGHPVRNARVITNNDFCSVIVPKARLVAPAVA